MMDKQYYRVSLGQRGKYAAEAIEGGFLCVGFIFGVDITDAFPENWQQFRQRYIPTFLEQNPDKTKIAAGLACGMLFTVGKGLQKGDIVLSPDTNGNIHVGEIIGDYVYDANFPFPHKRPVHWFDRTLSRDDFSDGLRGSIGSMGTVSNITKHSVELERLITNETALMVSDQSIEDPIVFALEKHLEDFLVANWANTPLGQSHDIFEDENGNGQQYPTDTGPMDILAISKDRKELLVVELKRGHASDAVVGQILRYMGYVKNDLAEEDQSVRGVIIALEDDLRLRNALSMTQGIDFYRYEVNFNLKPGGL